MDRVRWVNIFVMALAFALLTFIYYNSFGLTSDATIAIDDGHTYANKIEEGGGLFHPHHLLYSWIGNIIWRIQNYLQPAYEVRAVNALQMLSSLAGAFGVILIYLVLLKLTSKPGLSAAFSIGTAFSRGYWFYSASAESIVLGAVLSIPVFYVLVMLLEAPSQRRFLLLGVATAGACAVRQDNALLYLLVLGIVPFMKRGVRLKGFFIYTITLLAIMGLLQLICFSYVNTGRFSWGAFWQWSSGHARIPGWGTIENLKLPGLKVSLVKLIHTMGYGSVQNLVLVRPESLTKPICLFSQVNNILLIIFSLCFIFYILPRVRIRSTVQRVVILFCATWIVVRELFFAWCVPEPVMGFSVGTMIPLTIVITVALSSVLDRGLHRRAARGIIAGLVITTAISGLLTIIPFSKSTYVRRLAFFNGFSKPGDIIIVREFYHYILLAYYGSRQAAILDYYHGEKFRSLDEERIRTLVESAWAHRGKAFLMPAGGKADPFDSDKFEKEKAFFRSYKLRPLKSEDGAIVTWEVLPL